MLLDRINWVGLGVSVGIVPLALGMLEIGAQTLVPQWAPTSTDRSFWEYDELLGWAHTPNATAEMDHPDFSITVTHNAQGLRDRDYPLARVEGRRRMLLLGSSFSWGFGVEQDEIYAELVEARNPGWEIINAAVSGYGTDQELLYLQHRGRDFQPDVILMLVHHNDVAGNVVSTRYWHNKPRFRREGDGRGGDGKGELVVENQPVPPTGARQRIQKYFFTETSFFSTVYLRFQKARAVASRTATPQDPDAPRSTEGFELTRDLLLTLDETAKEMGAELVVLLAPTWRDDWTDFIGRELSQAGIASFDLTGPFTEANADGSLKFEHDRHWNASGHQVVADTVEAFLLEEGVLP